MLHERLLADVQDEENATLEKEIIKLTAKQTQMELTLAALKHNLAAQQNKVDQAKKLKDLLGARDLTYRQDNYNLYKSIFDFRSCQSQENHHRFFRVRDEQDEVVSYQIDVTHIDDAITTHGMHAIKLTELLAETKEGDARPVIRSAIAKTHNYVGQLEEFKENLEKNQVKIKHAIALYGEKLARLIKLTDELDYNEDILQQVLANIEGLKLTRTRCEALEKSHPFARP